MVSRNIFLNRSLGKWQSFCENKLFETHLHLFYLHVFYLSCCSRRAAMTTDIIQVIGLPLPQNDKIYTRAP